MLRKKSIIRARLVARSKKSSQKPNSVPARREGNRQGEGRYLETKQFSYRGPIPDPHTMNLYGQIDQNFPHRILAMAERQQEHRIDIEKIHIKGDERRSFLGVCLGFIIAFSALIGGLYLINAGRTGSGFTVLIVETFGIAGSFIYAKKTRRKDLDDHKE